LSFPFNIVVIPAQAGIQNPGLPLTLLELFDYFIIGYLLGLAWIPDQVGNDRSEKQERKIIKCVSGIS
jgi:hypothetical protein